ncbi:unnamed protein product [Sphagnum jensenii]|uniref:Uncharacterized protein n=1 Tax=Sphagnum jensenii TaxID=128206 RepID=A0ABP0WHL1_9BRYO
MQDAKATPAEEEAVDQLRAALLHPHGTALERRQRLLAAWTSLRNSVVPNSQPQAASTVEGRLKHHRHENREKRHSKKRRHVSECEGEGTQAASEKKVIEEKTRQLHEASREGNAARVAQLLSEGARITGKDDMGYTALHWASLYGHVQVVRMLLGAGAGDGKRINRVTNSGNTSLHFACTGQHAEVASLLQLYKPDVYATNSYGQTPVSLGLRRLVAAIEEEQRLAQVQDLRNQPLSDLLFREADWERQVNEGKGDVDRYKKGTHPASKPTVQRMWDTYQAAWSDFVRIYGEGTEGVSSSKATVIKFKNVPWPFILRQGDQEGDDELLLSQLEVSGPELHSLIQQERLRWVLLYVAAVAASK